jgi:hypothetical protein
MQFTAHTKAHTADLACAAGILQQKRQGCLEVFYAAIHIKGSE